ncbi:MAG: 7TM-DISM domain-containing protein [Limnobacter sp.]|nr:7TM-DISM domain-containing protein [Limnobacter sp.]
MKLSTTHSTHNNSVLAIALLCIALMGTLAALLSTPMRHFPDDSHLASKGYWMPPNGETVTLEQAQTQNYKPLKGMLIKGNQPREVWLKVQIKNQKPTQAQNNLDPLVLMVGPAYLNQADVFFQTNNGQWSKITGGYAKPYSTRPMDTVHFTVPLQLANNSEPRPEAVMDVYVHIKTDTAGVLLRVMTEAQAYKYDATLGNAFGLYLGLSVFTIFFCMIAWMATREKFWLDSLLFDAAHLYLLGMQSGMVARYLIPESMDIANELYVLAILLSLISATRISVGITALFKLPQWMRQVYKGGYLFFALSLVFFVTGQNGLSLLTSNFGLMLVSIWGLPVLLCAKHSNAWILNFYRGLTILFNSVLLIWISSILTDKEISITLASWGSGYFNVYSLFLVMMIFGYQSWLNAQQRQTLEQDQKLISARLVVEKERLAEATSFLSMIIHEVKNPLNYIRLATNNLSHDLQSSQESLKRLNHIKTSVTAIDNVLERSLQVDTLEHGAMSIDKQNYEVSALLDDFIMLTNEHDRVVLEQPESLWAHVDANLVLMMLRNLIDNALKYSPNDSPVQLRAKIEDQGLSLEVSNQVSTAGYPDPAQLFRKYYRSTQVMNISGTGLGLYWVQQVAKQMGGELRYKPQLQLNLVCFELWIPC